MLALANNCYQSVFTKPSWTVAIALAHVLNVSHATTLAPPLTCGREWGRGKG